MRLRIGVTLPFAKNALIYAATLNNQQSESAELALSILATLGFIDGMSLGPGRIVARLDVK